MTPRALVVRRAGLDDVGQILALAHRSLGWAGNDADAEFFRWKHFDNPCGASPMWVAVDMERVVGFRTFLRWHLREPNGSLLPAVRAVDTATDPDYQGRGIFTRLTLDAIDELGAEGIRLIFNTPNARSRPGYLKMGWSVVGRLPAAVRLTRVGSLTSLAGARRPASRWSIETAFGEPAGDVLADHGAVARLLATLEAPRGLATERTPAFLDWRYGFGPLHYRVVLAGGSAADGCAVFRLRRRGRAVEAAVCDVLVPGADTGLARSLVREIARHAGADYLIRVKSRAAASCGPSIWLPRTGPILTCKRLDHALVPGPADWALTLGDVELF